MVTTIDKAIVAGVTAAILAFATAQANGAELNASLIAAAGGFVVGLLTFLIPNKPTATV